MALFAYIISTKDRCVQECTAPYVRDYYQRMADTLSVLLAQAVPTVVSSRRDARFLGADACLLVQSWGQVVLGYMLPSLILDWCEKARCLPGWGASGPDWTPCRQSRSDVFRASMLYVGLFLGASVVGWMGLGLALAVWYEKLDVWIAAWRPTAQAGDLGGAVQSPYL